MSMELLVFTKFLDKPTTVGIAIMLAHLLLLIEVRIQLVRILTRLHDCWKRQAFLYSRIIGVVLRRFSGFRTQYRFPLNGWFARKRHR